MEGIDSSIILNRSVWKYSGHEETFNDPLVDCRECKSRFRADKLVEEFGSGEANRPSAGVACPKCGKSNWTEPRPFNLMFQHAARRGRRGGRPGALAYLRPETAQGIFINFLNVQTTMRRKLPFGIAQIGKSFRNEVTPGNFIFRTREFEQMEMEYFVRPGDDEHVHQSITGSSSASTGTRPRRQRATTSASTSSRRRSWRTTPSAPWTSCTASSPSAPKRQRQWDELMGIANRTDFDLKAHSKKPEDAEGKRVNPDSTEDLSYFDEATKERFYPYVIEPAVGRQPLGARLPDGRLHRAHDRQGRDARRS